MTSSGLYCEAGQFYIDPRRPVDLAVITHAHADHARRDSRRYLAARPGWRVLRRRLKFCSGIELLDYGEHVDLNGVKLSLHPAGHILGSAQVRMEYQGEVWVVSGDYKLDEDPTCAPFEPVRCHTFVSESTFGMPVFRWPDPQSVYAEINSWWEENQRAARPSLLFAYALGKAQRILMGIDPSIGELFTHDSVEWVNRDYRDSGVALPRTTSVRYAPRDTDWTKSLVIAPPTVRSSAWARRFPQASTAAASGWFLRSGERERQTVERGFVLSDHADWPGLLSAIESTGAERVWLVHGEGERLAEELVRRGLQVILQ